MAFPRKFSGEDIDAQTDSGQLCLFDVEWDCDQDIVGESEAEGYVYGDPYNHVFLSAHIGSFDITRDILVAMSCEAHIRALEVAKNEATALA